MNVTPQEILDGKRKGVRLTLEDLFSELEDPTWRQKHPLGPVHIQISCLCCGKIVASDLKDFGWFHNPSFVQKHLIPHYLDHKNEN